ncbi:MAG: biopolymer transporter ExbD [Verrucomicrobia bacterium]|nr:biopolymer transporter ExbD [Verrucomicrobiota bacterium]
MRKPRSYSDDDSHDEPLINLTPLIDVVFVVLITFMLIAPVLDLDHVELAASGPSSQKEASPANQSPLSIHVKADNSIWFQGQALSIGQLEERLRIEKKRHPHQTPQVIQDYRAQFGTYQAVKNTLEICGFDQMDVVLKPK